jgi:hypothetical protein
MGDAYARKFAGRFDGFAVDEAALRAYQGVHGVPDSIVRCAVAAASDAEAEAFAKVRSVGGL